MHFLRRRVFTLVALCFAFGIVCANEFDSIFNPHILTAVAALCTLAAAIVFRSRNTVYALIAMLLSCAVLGSARLWSERALVLSAPLTGIARESPGQHAICGRIVGFPRLGGEYVRAVVSVDSIDGVESGDPLGCLMLFWRSEGDRDLVWGDRVDFSGSIRIEQPPRNPGEFDYRMYLLDRGAVVTAFVFGRSGLEKTGIRNPLLQRYCNVRQALFEKLTERQKSPYAELLVSLVYGDKTTELEPEVREEFRRAGMTHILVVSGTQVSLIVFLLVSLLSPGRDDLARRGILRRTGVCVAIVLIVFVYCTLTGFETSVLRAFVMGVAILVARLSHRDSDGFGELARSALVILAVQPGQLFGASFQLSYAACFGLIYIYSLFGPSVATIRLAAVRFVLVTLTTTAGAQLFVAPILAAHFNQFSAWGLPANLLAIPLASILLLIGVLHNLIAFVAPEPVTVFSAAVLSLGLNLLRFLAHFFGNLDGSDVRVASPSPLVITLFYITVLTAGELFKRRRRLVESVVSFFRRRILMPVPLSREIAVLFIILAISLSGFAIVMRSSEPSYPRIVLLAGGDSLSMVLQVDGNSTYAFINPSGSDPVKRNQVRDLKSLCDHFGVKVPESVFLLDDPGDEGMEEANLEWRNNVKAIFDDDTIPDTADSPALFADSVIVEDAGVTCTLKKTTSSVNVHSLWIGYNGVKVVIFDDVVSRSQILRSLDGSSIPDVLCLKTGNGFGIDGLLQSLRDKCLTGSQTGDIDASGSLPELVRFGRSMDYAIEIRLQEGYSANRVSGIGA